MQKGSSSTKALELKGINKTYGQGDYLVNALVNVDLSFRKNEFVSILGPSGCGKTTLLNIIGGLDRYTSGDLIIDGTSTKNYKDGDWDVYRNHRIGFVFQSYNLIPHQTVLGNVELALTIAGVSKEERRQRAKETLKRVGLEHEIHKRPNQLSGGQMQRVAIARALVNNPEILLADEPTGALDSVTSVQIMDLIKEIASERLVIMVTHNPEIAEQYSTRIVKLSDGLVVSDSNPLTSEEESQATLKEEKPKKRKKRKDKTSMNLKTALGLSGRNLLAKRARTALTSFAGSIGIISVCLVLALSNGFNKYILKTEEDMLSYNPIEITETTMDMEAIMSGMSSLEDLPELDKIGDRVYVNSFLTNIAGGMQVKNNLSDEYVKYLNAMPKEYYSAIHYETGISLTDNLFTTAKLSTSTDKNAPTETKNLSLSALKSAYVQKLGELDSEENTQYSQLVPLVQYLGNIVNVMPGTLDFNDQRFSQYVLSQYDVVKGSFPKSKNQALLVIGPDNDVTDLTLAQLGLMEEEQFFAFVDKTQEDYDPYVDFTDVLAKPYTLYYNDAVYSRNHIPLPNNPYAFNYNSQRDNLSVDNGNGVQITISGILRLKEGRTYGCLANGLNLTEALVKEYTEKNSQSELVRWIGENQDQKITIGETSISQLYYTSANLSSTYGYTAEATGGDYSNMKRAVGALNTVNKVNLYTESFQTKEHMLNYLDEWNDTTEEEKHVKYTDTVGLMMGMVETMLDAITYVLVAFTSISLIVSSVMIGIITYVSVVERTKEIGVLRAIGARKRDIKNLFNAETFIIGFTAGGLGVVVSYLLSGIINLILGALTGIGTLCSLPFGSALIMIAVSVSLTLISGLIPAGAAAKKDPVVALRSE